MDSDPTSSEQSENEKVHPPRFYKYCIVPGCSSTTFRTPDKIFFQVPKNPKIRKEWCAVIKREPLASSTSVRYCCEDHFELEDDMANYWEHRLMKSVPRLKPGVLPKKFSCQIVAAPTPQERTLMGKKTKKREIELLEEAQEPP